MPADPKADNLLGAVVSLAEAAGERILAIYGTEFDVEKKGDDSPLTAADMASHRLIVDALQSRGAEPVLSEESAGIGYEQRRRWTRYWLVDPLDGTKEFIKRNGEFTVNIALIDSGRPVLGVVHAPALGRSWFARQSLGAFHAPTGGPAERIAVRKPAARPVRVVGSRSHRGASLDRYLERLGEHELVAMGSSMKLCLVAEGSADVYPRLGPTCEWDTAAAHAVVVCAGGGVVDVEGQPLAYNRKERLENPHFIAYGDDGIDWSRFL